jgi:hypothetical protein
LTQLTLPHGDFLSYQTSREARCETTRSRDSTGWSRCTITESAGSSPMRWSVQLFTLFPAFSIPYRAADSLCWRSQGLGKTLQTISFLGYLKFHQGIKGPHLVVVPKSTLQNWDREFHKWVPGFETVILQGTKDERVSLFVLSLGRVPLFPPAIPFLSRLASSLTLLFSYLY